MVKESSPLLGDAKTSKKRKKKVKNKQKATKKKSTPKNVEQVLKKYKL